VDTLSKHQFLLSIIMWYLAVQITKEAMQTEEVMLWSQLLDVSIRVYCLEHHSFLVSREFHGFPVGRLPVIRL